ncbi:hypothetical protein [Flavobacterium sp. HBTb2-11-1]|uniref:hypothetical protein n=1 Tax=Flavobacterium sp. HBTb2-11-1 TaxID=2692212 RepID=UPI001925243B|nr:hypothetical protein [Flavobacterium sp. HBTb2-11-1]
MKRITIKGHVLFFIMCLIAGFTTRSYAQADPREVRKENFKGVIELDVRNSKPDWKPYTPKSAPEGLSLL